MATSCIIKENTFQMSSLTQISASIKFKIIQSVILIIQNSFEDC
jgi:hypothetical protein